MSPPRVAATLLLLLTVAASFVVEGALSPAAMDGLERGCPAWLSPPLLATILLLAGLGLLAAVLRSSNVPSMRAFAAGSFVYVGAVALSATLPHVGPGPNQAGIVSLALARYLIWTAAAFVGWRLARRGEDESTEDAIVFASLLLSATVLLDAHGLWRSSPQARVPGGLLGNRNFVGELLGLVLPLCLIRLEGTRRRWLLPVLGATLVYTRCRSGWIAALVGTVIVLALTPAPLRRARGLALGLMLAGALVAIAAPSRLRWTEDRPYLQTLSTLTEVQSGSGRMRVRQYVDTTATMSGHWLLGHGVGRWRYVLGARDPFTPRARIPHSDYLRALSDGGLIALGGLLTALGAATLAAWRARRAHPAVFASLIALGLLSLADAPLYRPESALAALLLATLALARAGAEPGKVAQAHA